MTRTATCAASTPSAMAGALAAPRGYSTTAKTLHWLMAVLIIGLLTLGIYMHELPLSPEKLKLYSWHKWAGVTAFLLIWVRIAWRVTHAPPPLPATMSAAAKAMAAAGHGTLYLLMVAIPLTGWLMSSAKGFQTVWFGVVPIPDLLPKNKELGDALQGAHKALNIVLMAVILGHVLAALKHRFIDRDGVFARMMPGALVIVVAWLAAPGAARAIEYNQVLADKSSVRFAYQQMGVAMDGRFRRFTSQLAFDPARAETGKVSFDVELGSVDTGSSEADQEVLGKPWFDAKAFPTARFTSTSVKSVGPNRYEVSGKLGIKGRSRDLVVPASFSAQGATGVFEGAFTIRRGDFSIGEGAWAKFDVVANDVKITFRITATGK